MQDRRRDLIANSLLIYGVIQISVGVGMVYLPAGLVVFGAFCVIGGYLLARNN